MYLSPEEQEMLNGAHGAAKKAAMELLVEYGEALGAEKMVPISSACVGTPAGNPPALFHALSVDPTDIDAIFSKLVLRSKERIEICPLAVNSCTLASQASPEYYRRVAPEQAEDAIAALERAHKFQCRIGINTCNTCAPYLTGIVPARGEHCAWGESSAVIYANSVLGARTNCEGVESYNAAALVGRIPYAGLHTDEGRRGTHLIQVQDEPHSSLDWELMGYYIGKRIGVGIPVICGITTPISNDDHKRFGSALATSGGVDMYHMVGYTPEAPTMEAAFGTNMPKETIVYTDKERQEALDRLNFSQEKKVDLVLLGCPHYSIEQLKYAIDLMRGKKLKAELYLMTAHQTKHLADIDGYTKIAEEAGAFILTDGCPPQVGLFPAGANTIATDAAKQAHYLPAFTPCTVHFGSTKQCIEAAITGEWSET